MIKNLLLCTLLFFVFTSCKKKGCTDCNAINYSASANTNDNSCEFVNEEYIGWYVVSDSILGPPSMEWDTNSYEMNITRSICEPNNLLLSNYADLSNSFRGINFQVKCVVTDSSFSIPSQLVEKEKIRQSSGHFYNDSVFFDIEFENEFGEVFIGKTFGVKKYR